MEVLARYKFEAMVADALDDLPDELLHVLDNVVVQVVDRHPDEPYIVVNDKPKVEDLKKRFPELYVEKQ